MPGYKHIPWRQVKHTDISSCKPCLTRLSHVHRQCWSASQANILHFKRAQHLQIHITPSILRSPWQRALYVDFAEHCLDGDQGQ
jgi:hypothetical protein